MLRGPFLILVIAAFLLANSGAGVRSTDEDRYVEELVDLVAGDANGVKLQLGYPISGTIIVDDADQAAPTYDYLNTAAFAAVFWPLDSAYGDFFLDTGPHALNVGRLRADPTEVRIQAMIQNRIQPLKHYQGEGRASLLVILLYNRLKSPPPARLVSRLLGGKRIRTITIGRDCSLHQWKDDRQYAGINVVTLGGDTGNELNLADSEVFRCLFSSQIYNLGFSGAVDEGRLDRFPMGTSFMEGCRFTPKEVYVRRTCYSPIRKRSYYIVMRHLVRTRAIRPGYSTRAELKAAIRAGIDSIGWETLRAVDWTNEHLPSQPKPIKVNPTAPPQITPRRP